MAISGELSALNIEIGRVDYYIQIRRVSNNNNTIIVTSLVWHLAREHTINLTVVINNIR